MELENKIWEYIEKIKKTTIEERDNEEWLTGIRYNMDSVDMAYLVLSLQQEFGIKFEKKDFKNYQFATVSDIAKVILVHQ